MSVTHDVLKIQGVKRVSLERYLSEQSVEYNNTAAFRCSDELKARINIKAACLKIKPAEFMRQQMIAATDDVELTS